MQYNIDTLPETNGGYRVDLDVFCGPLDLLLHLIRKEEVDIRDIPIARITRQYLKYIDAMKTLNLEIAGEFILMAATLIRVKTRLLLPRDEIDSDEPDPREELILALMEYKKFKEAGDVLRERALREERNYVPPSPVGRIEGRVDLSPATTLWDLVLAYRDLLATRRADQVHEVNLHRVSIRERMLVILQRLQDDGDTTFGELFADMPRKLVAVVTFIAILELARTRRIRIDQAAPFSQLRVYPGEAFHIPVQETDILDYQNETTQGVDNGQ